MHAFHFSLLDHALNELIKYATYFKELKEKHLALHILLWAQLLIFFIRHVLVTVKPVRLCGNAIFDKVIIRNVSSCAYVL